MEPRRPRRAPRPAVAAALLASLLAGCDFAAAPERPSPPDDLGAADFRGGPPPPRPGPGPAPGPAPPRRGPDGAGRPARRAPAGAPDVATLPARRVERVVDGDTLVLDGGERVRLIGIDTPETVDPRKPVEWYGREASAKAKSLLDGRRVHLEYDVHRTDRYGRSLAYVYLEDGTQVNLVMIEDGFAFAYRYPPNVKYADAFSAAQRAAREAGRGLWSDPAKAGPMVPKGR